MEVLNNDYSSSADDLSVTDRAEKESDEPIPIDRYWSDKTDPTLWNESPAQKKYRPDDRIVCIRKSIGLTHWTCPGLTPQKDWCVTY